MNPVALGANSVRLFLISPVRVWQSLPLRDDVGRRKRANALTHDGRNVCGEARIDAFFGGEVVECRVAQSKLLAIAIAPRGEKGPWITIQTKLDKCTVETGARARRLGADSKQVVSGSLHSQSKWKTGGWED